MSEDTALRLLTTHAVAVRFIERASFAQWARIENYNRYLLSVGLLEKRFEFQIFWGFSPEFPSGILLDVSLQFPTKVPSEEE